MEIIVGICFIGLVCWIITSIRMLKPGDDDDDL